MRSGWRRSAILARSSRFGAGAVAEGEAGAAVLEGEHVLDVGGVLAGEAELGTHARVPVLGERLGQLDGQAVQFEVVAVGVGLEELGGLLADPGADGDDLEADDVGLAGLLRAEEVGQAQPAAAALAREGEAGALVALLVQEDQVVVLGDAGEVAVDDGRFEEVVGLELVQEAAQAGPALGLDEFLVRRSVAGAGLLEAPLALEEGALVEPGRRTP